MDFAIATARDPGAMAAQVAGTVLEVTHLGALMGGEDEERYAPRSDSCALRVRAHALMRSSRFNGFIIGLILTNTCTLSAEAYEQSALKTDVLTYCNLVFTAAFTLEMLVKLTALTPRGYVGDSLNTVRTYSYLSTDGLTDGLTD